MNDRKCSLQMCGCSTGISTYYGIVWKRNRWSLFDLSAITVNSQEQLTTIDNIWWSFVIPRKKPAGKTSLSAGPPPKIPLSAPELRQWRGARSSTARQGLVKEIFIPGQKMSSWWKIIPIKDDDPD